MQINSSAEVLLWIAQPLRWKIVDLHDTPAETPPTLIDSLFSRSHPVTDYVATVEMQIIREKVPISICSNAPTNIYPDILLDSAFVPNTFRINVERGEFRAPRNGRPNDNIYKSIFGLQMTMDKSLYPQMEAWRANMKDMLEQMRPFNKCCFVAQQLEDRQSQGGFVSM